MTDSYQCPRCPPRPERWATIPGCLYYEVSDKGRVRSLPRVVHGRRYVGKLLTTRPQNKRYIIADVVDAQGQPRTRTVHSMELGAFWGPCPPGMEACHEDDDPGHNCYPENLRWDTPAANLADRHRNRGLPPPPSSLPPLPRHVPSPRWGWLRRVLHAVAATVSDIGCDW